MKPDSPLSPPTRPADSRWVTAEQPPTLCPVVRQQRLYLDQAAGHPPYCLLDSPAWFAWLETAITFRYQTTTPIPVAHGHARPAGPISLRKERRRHGFFWYAYRRQRGQLLKRYAGRSAALTIARLDSLAIDLNLA